MQNTPTITLEPNRQITSRQFHDCLQAIATLVGCVRMAAGTTGGTPSGELPTPGIPALDGEVRAALDLSLIKVCDRLDQIMGADSRWEQPERDMHTLGVKVLEQQIIAQQQVNRSTEMQLRALEKRLEDENQLFHEALQATLTKEFQNRLDALNGDVPKGDRVTSPEPPTTKP